MDTPEIQRTMQECCERLQATKISNIEEMEKVSEIYNLPKVSHEGVENLNRLITSKKSDTAIKNLPHQKSPGPDGFTGEF